MLVYHTSAFAGHAFPSLSYLVQAAQTMLDLLQHVLMWEAAQAGMGNSFE